MALSFCVAFSQQGLTQQLSTLLVLLSMLVHRQQAFVGSAMTVLIASLFATCFSAIDFLSAFCCSNILLLADTISLMAATREITSVIDFEFTIVLI